MAWWLVVWFAVVAVAAPSAPEAEPSEPPAVEAVRVAVSPFAPFVHVEPGEEGAAEAARGFSLDLWEAVAREAGLSYDYVVYDNVGEKLDAVERAASDVAIGGISLTSAREARVDFTQPTFRTGLDILTLPEARSALGLGALQEALTPSRVGILLGFALLIVVSGHLVWLAERGRDAFDDKYVPGVFEGMYWAIVTASTVGYGDKAPVRWPGRLVAALVIVVSLPMFAVFTAELASTLTVSTLSSGIRGKEDLRGRAVAVVEGTTSQEVMARAGAEVFPVPSVEEGVRMLLREEVTALVHDAPSIQQLARQHEAAVAVGNLFAPQRYAMAVPQGSPLRERLDRALLELQERGEWSRIRDRWFEGGLGE